MAQKSTLVQPVTPRRKRLILLCASLTSCLIMLDSNIVAISLPSIARDLHASFTGIEWVISAYIVTFAALLLAAGSLADLHGRRRAVLAGLAIFTIASGVCGLATSEFALEAARALQGVGASLLLPSALAIIASTFRGNERPKAYAFWGTCIGVAITSGPIVGGLITGLFGWRWAFLINLPLCVGFVVATLVLIPESRDPEARRLDWLGVITFSAGLFSLTWALIDGNHAGWSSAAIVARLVAALLLMVAFIVVESLQPRPMLDLSLFRRRDFAGAAFGMAGYGAGAQVMIFFLPLYLQGAFAFSPQAAGLAMLPFAVPLFIAPRAAATLLAGWSHRDALILAMGIVTAGNLLMAGAAHLEHYVLFSVAMLIAGIGTGILNPETVKAMQAEIPPDRAGMASGVNATTRFTSLLVGVAALGAVMARSNPFFTATRDAHAASAFTAVALGAACIATICLLSTATLMHVRAPVGVRRLPPQSQTRQ